MATVQVDVVSAERSLYSGVAKFVVLPGESGELGREVRVIKPEGEDTTHDLDAILHDHLTPKKMIAKIKSMHSGKSILTEGEA